MKRKQVLLIALFVLLALSVTVTLTLAQGPTGTKAGRSPRAALGTAFTYQGQLKNSGSGVNGTCDLQFGLWDDASVGTLQGVTQTVTAVNVSSGLFTTPIDFGAGMFDGNRRWLAIAVRCPTATGSYTPLTTRQELTATPYALFSANAPWSGLTGVPNPVTFLASPSPCSNGQVATWNGTTWTCVDQTIAYRAWVTANFIDAIQTGAGSGLTGGGGSGTIPLSIDTSYKLPQTCTSGQLARWNGSMWECVDAVTPYSAGFGLLLNSNQFSVVTSTVQQRVNGTCTSGNAIRVINQDGTVTCEPIPTFSGWALTGNSGTTYGTNFLGTTDNVSLTLRANNVVGWRLAPSGTNTPNVIGGYSGNWVTSGVQGATIGGGGAWSNTNRVTDDYGTVGGGYNNQVGDNVGDTADMIFATIGGGHSNTASDYAATVGGGQGNTASKINATVGGGASNIAGGAGATVPGGLGNVASGNYSFAAGQYANTNNKSGAFVWGDNSTSTYISATVANEFLVRASGGITMYTNSGATTGVQVAPGGGSWSSVSDKNLKANFADVNSRDILARVGALPIQTWNYTSQDPSIHHIGPMAQDFYAAFKVGEDDTHITAIDSEGVALAAIQGLYQIVQEKDAKIAAQQKQIDDLDARLTALEQSTVVSKSPLNEFANNGWMLGALLVAAVLIGTRRWGGTR